MSFFSFGSFLSFGSSVNPSIAWVRGRHGEGRFRITLPLDPNWYKEQACTRFQILEHRKERNGLQHEFIVLKLEDKSICRIERMGDPDASFDAIGNQGIAAYDVAQSFPPDKLSDADLDTSDVVAEITFPYCLDLEIVLLICSAMQEGEKTCNYTLQVFNCYFFSLAIQAALTRLVADWETSFRDESWRSAVGRGLSALSDFYEAAPFARGQQPFILRMHSALRPDTRWPAEDLMYELKQGLWELTEVSQVCNAVLWYSDMGLAVDYVLCRRIRDIAVGVLKANTRSEDLLLELASQAISEQELPTSKLNRIQQCIQRKTHLIREFKSFLSRVQQAEERVLGFFPSKPTSHSDPPQPRTDSPKPRPDPPLPHSISPRPRLGTSRLISFPFFNVSHISVWFTYAKVFALWTLHAVLGLFGIDLLGSAQPVSCAFIEDELEPSLAILKASENRSADELTLISQTLQSLIAAPPLLMQWKEWPWDHIYRPIRRHVPELLAKEKHRLQSNTNQATTVSRLQEHLLERIRDHAKRVESFKLGSAAEIQDEMEDRISQVWALIRIPASAVVLSARFRLRIQSIEVGFKVPSRYPINIKLLSNGRLLYNLKPIGGDQPLRWEDVNPIDIDRSGSIEIRVYELHWYGRKRERVGAVSFEVRELVNSGSSVTACDDSGSPPLSVSVTLVPTGDSHSTAQNAQNTANASVAMSPGLLESMGRTRDAVETILKIGQSLTELSPIVMASVELCAQAWEALKTQDQCDALVAKLVAEMGDVLPHVVAVEDRAQLADLWDTLKDLILLVEDASRFMIEYKSDGAAVRAVRTFVSSSAQSQVDEFVDRFGRLKESFDRGMAIQVVQRVEKLLDDADRALLKPLIVPGARYDPSRGCLVGTRMGILDDIRDWALSDDSTGFFWLYGPAGCGKSAVSTSMSEFLHNAGDLGGSFFCKRDNEHLRRPENVISHLAASLAFGYPEYGTKLLEALRRDPELAYSPLKTRFAGLIADPLQSIGRYENFRATIVVVDAIDESGTADGRAELVRCLLQLSRLANWLKVLVTSRPNEEIHDLLGPGQEGIERQDLFAEDEASVSGDIIAYIRSRMNAIPADTTGRDQWPDEGEIYRLSTRSNGLFIWVRTACNLIQQSLDPDATVKQILAGRRTKGAEKALGQIYTIALNEGLGEANDDANIIQLCVGAIVLTGSRRPLPDGELAAILAGRIEPHALSRVVNRLGSVLYRDDNGAVRVLHQSFSDYITGDDCPEEYRTDAVVLNAELAASCLQVMLRGLRFNICGLESSSVMNRDVPDLQSRIERNISPGLSYSCLHWTTHLTTPTFATISPRTLKLLDEFLLGEHLLYWIEVASLTGELYAIAEGMHQFMNWINDPQNKYTKIADDVYRFLWAAVEPISSSTPRLYTSTLADDYETLRTLRLRVASDLRDDMW